MPRAKGGSVPPPRVAFHPGQGGLISDLNNNDVLSGRGGRINNHPGNILFRHAVDGYKREYLDPRTRKLEKAHVAARLVAQIRSANPPGRFLREDPKNLGMFLEIGDQKAWKKAGQALREDAPDVRKEIDQNVEDTQKTAGHVIPKPTTAHHYQPPPPNHYQQRPPVLSGIPPSVSYSPNTPPVPLAPPAQQNSRPDPPEAEGVTGYRTAPLNYFAQSGRGARPGTRPPEHFPGRGQGGPPPQQHQYPGHPPQQYQGHPPPNFYSHHPNMPPPNQQYQYQQQQYHQYPPQAGQQVPPPHSTQEKKGRKKSKSPTPPVSKGPVHAAASMAAMADFTFHEGAHVLASQAINMVKHPHMPKFHKHQSPQKLNDNSTNTQQTFPAIASVATDFTMSDVSAIGDSTRTSQLATPAALYPTSHPAVSLERQAHQDAHNHRTLDKKSSSRDTKNSSGKTEGSLTMSEISMSGLTNAAPNITASMGMWSFNNSGLSRTQSFPDFMLSTGDYPLHVPPPETETQEGLKTGGMLKPPIHRQNSTGSDSMASVTIKGFNPVRGRTNTAMSGLHDAMSIMSIDSRKSLRSENSSWLDNFRSMQSIHSDAGNSLKLGDEASVRSLLSDMSNEVNALDLAEPLLPPYQHFNYSNGSAGFMSLVRPDP